MSLRSQGKALSICQGRYDKNPKDTKNLTLWANLLIDISRYEKQDDPRKRHLIQEAIKKLEYVLVLDPKNHYALWCIGDAYVCIAFPGTTMVEAIAFYDEALKYYKQAYGLKPENSAYKRAVEKTEATKVELQEIAHEDMTSGPSSTTTKVELQAMASAPSSTSSKDEEKRIEKIDMPLDPLDSHPQRKALRICQGRHDKNPEDTENLTLWANLLIGMSRSQDQDDPHKRHLVQEAIKKLEKVLVLDPNNHYALWSTGKAYICIAFSGTTIVEAIALYDKALQYYKQAYDMKPESSAYKQALKRAEATKVKLLEIEQKAMASGPSSY